jgi:quinoprotein glucose dehydrogenase
VFLPTSTPAPDSWGGLRPGDNRYANSIVALRGATGEVVWHFQVVHHAIWDYDVAAQPLLVDLPRDGNTVPALVQNTKQGLVFVFNRETGEPLFPIEERPVPRGDLPGEWYSPTQPFPVKPPPLVPHGSSPDDAWGFTWWDRRACRRMIEELRHGPIYTPPSEQGTIVSPWPGGGVNWGGAAYEPARHWMIVNTNRLMKVVQLTPAGAPDGLRPASSAAATANSHAHVEYDPPVRLIGTPYRYEEGLLLSPLGAPCNKPPWGALTAVDLVKGEIAWQVPLGSIEQFLPVPIPWRLGTPNIGGPIVTAGGLVFIGATMDGKLRAFAVADGRELWHADLPAPAMTSPITYEAAGRQFVVIVAGGSHELPGPRSDRTVAYALP